MPVDKEVAAAGEVEISKSVTVQVQEFHPVVTSVSLRLPIEEGETPKQAIARVRKIVEADVDKTVVEVVRKKFYWK